MFFRQSISHAAPQRVNFARSRQTVHPVVGTWMERIQGWRTGRYHEGRHQTYKIRKSESLTHIYCYTISSQSHTVTLDLFCNLINNCFIHTFIAGTSKKYENMFIGGVSTLFQLFPLFCSYWRCSARVLPAWSVRLIRWSSSGKCMKYRPCIKQIQYSKGLRTRCMPYSMAR